MEQAYLQLLADVLQNGEDRMDRTKVGTRSVFGRQIRCNLEDGFPALTTKKLFWKPVVGELLWFLEGSQDNRRLAELTYDDQEHSTIWTGNAEADYWKPKATFPGDTGRIYGVQWRRWVKTEVKGYEDYLNHHDETNATTYFGAKVQTSEIDQIANIINKIKTNPADRRMVLTAFNVGEMDQMSLPPCHMFAQFHVSESGRLSCQVYIRSNDLFLGLPFNIASYALLTHMMAHVTGKTVGDLIITIGDAHIYQNHKDQVKEQLTRSILKAPRLSLNADVKNIDDFKMTDILLMGYESHPAIKAPMAV
jgi:thymidylate synthase